MVFRLSIITFVLCASTFLKAQNFDENLTILPPMPNLYLGDPERPLSGKMKRALAREEERKRQAEEEELRDIVPFGVEVEEEPKKKTLFKKREEQAYNSISSKENARTSDGTLLRPFGDPDYWGGIEEPDEQDLALLPPMPDLRVSDQVTRREKRRNKLVMKAEVRKLNNEAARAEKEARRVAAAAPVVHLDPSTAHSQVHSERGAPAASIQSAPMTQRSRNLKPFNEDSAYYYNGMLMSQGEPRQGDNRFRLFKKNGE